MEITATLAATNLPGWFHKESITLLAPDGQANVIASSEPLDPAITTTQYAMIQGDLLSREFPGYTEHTFESAWVFGITDGYIRDFSWTPPDGVQVRQMQCYAVRDGRGYTATATVPTSQFARFESELRRLLASLRIVA
jgi:hypothetical protein